jgi:hypothetical protein
MADNLLITTNVDGMHFVNQGLACLSFHKVLDNELILSVVFPASDQNVKVVFPTVYD